jgi:hypothetical protein
MCFTPRSAVNCPRGAPGALLYAWTGMGIVGWQIEFVSQPEVHSELGRDFPVILNKQMIVRRDCVPIRQARTELCKTAGAKVWRNARIADKKISESREIDFSV